MNKFNIPNPSGGFKLKAHDLNLIYSYLAEGIGGVAGQENAILSGCRVTNSGTTSSITEGYVALNGEIYKVEAQSWDIFTVTDPCFSPVETVVSPSPRVSADASSKDVHFKRVATIQQYGAQAVKARFTEMGDYGYEYKPVLLAASPGTIYDTRYSGSWIPAGTDLTNAGFETLKVRKVGRYLELVGCCEISSFSASQIAQLPDLLQSIDGASLVPTKNTIIMVPLAVIGAGPGLSYTVGHTVYVGINTDGEIFVDGSTYTADAGVFLVFNHRVPLF
jgi:hypothetical protein